MASEARAWSPVRSNGAGQAEARCQAAQGRLHLHSRTRFAPLLQPRLPRPQLFEEHRQSPRPLSVSHHQTLYTEYPYDLEFKYACMQAGLQSSW